GAVAALTMIRRSWPEVALQTQDRAPDALARREVHAGRTAACSREVEHHLVRIMLGLDACVEHFEADIELRRRVPDRPQAHAPGAEVRVAARHDRRAGERRVRSGKPTDRALRRRAEDRRRYAIVVSGGVV